MREYSLREHLEAELNASGAVYRALFRMILTRRLKGPVVEKRLAEALGVPRPPVRAALNRLLEEELLVRDDNCGLVVRRVTPDEMAGSSEVWEVLESEAAALAAGYVPPEKIAAVRESMTSLWNSMASEETLWRLDDALHDLVADYCGNPVMAPILRSLRTTTRLYILQSCERRRPRKRLEAALRDHLKILDALEAGDAAGARKAMRTHLKGDFAQARL